MAIAANVETFIEKASAMCGRIAQKRFEAEMYYSCLEMEMESPIEHLFWIACHLMCFAHDVGVNKGPQIVSGNYACMQSGIYIKPQTQIDNYRVDFLLWQEQMAPEGTYPPVVVELDGHDFHDKDKRQRSYEKARDRHLVRKGYRVLHFTGSDVVQDPFKVAYEALDLLGLFFGTEITCYDRNNPLNLES